MVGLEKAIGNPMRGSPGFPTSASPAESLKALPPSLFCRAHADPANSTYPAIVMRWPQIIEKSPIILILMSLYAIPQCHGRRNRPWPLSNRIDLYLFG